jgi:hypothetical protein
MAEVGIFIEDADHHVVTAVSDLAVEEHCEPPFVLVLGRLGPPAAQ